MWYGLVVVFLLVSLYAGYRMTLSMDKHLEENPEKE